MKDNVVIPVWSIGTFLVVMNTTMFNVSLPEIIAQLHITAGLASWIVSGYSIGFALSTIIFSRLSDFIPIRKLLAIGLTCLGVSSVLGFMAQGFDLLLTARLLQSCGAGAMPGLGMVLASRYVPFERRGRAITMIASGSALAFGVGPVAGGIITEFFGWQELFLVTCLVIPLVPVLWRLLPKEEQKKVRFDFVGAALIVVTAAALLIAIASLSVIFLIVSIAAAILLFKHLYKAKEPFIQPLLFRNSGYRKLIFMAFSAFVLNMSMLFLMPLILANGFHKSAAAVGLMIFPGALLSACLMNFVGRWIDRYGNMRFLLAGHILMGLSLVFISLGIHISAFVITFAYLIFAPSLSTITSTLSNEVSRILPKEQIGSGMGLSQLSQYMGGSFAVALCGLLIVWQDEIAPLFAYQHIYILLVVVLLLSLFMLRRYTKSREPLKSELDA
ncbi:MFS transporter [Paenibacillus radicis (ex Xue et al. 2023)]|uniref:MFS transporter n=1 Tax=Paenibacillus radicis (ex Xue et al. 2023) TaxID=2972489 RepID=A0ABT1YNI1_9BACL|nr:MFS transporter [Paenibacillus radicis (ex Xue et al. 2023)]MCR8634265.1 MFS transporter [Paenibacillus radicis (ex Xue et al. 2023)]